MNRQIIFLATTILILIILSALACGKFSGSRAGNAVNSENSINEKLEPNATPPKSESRKIEKADFTMTVEELVEEFMREAATSEDLKKKYAGKNIVVTGRVTMFSFEPNGTAPPYVVLAAPKTEGGVICYIGSSGETGRNIRMDKIITMQGLMDQFPMAGTSPQLGDCFVLKAD